MTKPRVSLTRDQRRAVLAAARERKKLDDRILLKKDKAYALLDEIEVLESERVTNKDLAAKYNVSESNVYWILHGRRG